MSAPPIRGTVEEPGRTDPAELEAARHAARGLGHASRLHAVLARALWTAGHREEAASVLQTALRLGGGQPEDHEALGFVAFGLNEHVASRDFYANVVGMAPGDGLARYNLASSERNLGRLDEAEASCEAALARDPRLFQAALLRSQLKTQRPEANHVEALRASLGKHGDTPQAQIFLNYALGKEYEDLGDHDPAFFHFQAGALARRRALDYRLERDLEILARLQTAFPRQDAPPATRDTGQFGFILGLPRSGTTLIERVLTGHPNVRSNGETDNFSGALMQALPAGPGDLFAKAAAAPPASVAAAYERLAGSARPGGLVLEKLPLNYLYVGAIRKSLPEAPIILVQRNGLDNCLGMFTTLFGSAYPFSYDLGELGAYFVAYRRLIDHWVAASGDRLLVVPYEAFVMDPETWGQRVASFAGVPWRSHLLNITENRTPSTTASAVQVRRPIYRGAVGRWRHYARHLAPLRDLLAAHGFGPEQYDEQI